MKRSFEVGDRQVGPLNIVAVGFVDRHQVGKLQNALLDALQLIAGAGQHEDAEHVHHVGHHGLGLADAHGFHQHHVVPGGFADQHRFPGHAGDPAQRGAGGRWSHERLRVDRQACHACLVTQDRSAGARTGGIDRQHGDPVAGGGQVDSQLVDKRALTHARHAGDADSMRPAGVGHQPGQYLACHRAVFGTAAFDQGDRAAEYRPVARPGALYVALDVPHRSHRSPNLVAAETVPGGN